MTNEEKAKAYDEVVVRINKAVSDGLVSENFGRDMLGIAESEDERIRKFLIKLVSNDKKAGYISFYEQEGISWDDAIAYLEKQKEPAPIPDKFNGLKSLRSRPKVSDNWKPSEEQMEALRKRTLTGSSVSLALYSLYRDLTKLAKEESK